MDIASPALETPNSQTRELVLLQFLHGTAALCIGWISQWIWKVHPIFSIAMLEPAPKGEEPYHRYKEEGQQPVVDNEDPIVKIDVLLRNSLIGRLCVAGSVVQGRRNQWSSTWSNGKIGA